MSATTASLETAMMLRLDQILDGEASCHYCDRAAVATLATGADPEPDPVCAKHALRFLDSTRLFVAGPLDSAG